ncbi:hypothetical protein MettiDRAFT_0760 [Methanolobus tindarius DSM 2278]|uniref:Uncharacterized protein n=1 Tax=Methanolobus tindarius DSM 2278 TaxID=1090322 RepID=W9DQ20_METTI|nr:hypothetical protein [Methanolobus tindarius]ETA67340.1 hypothetical protein MettiDRAFT_0760 [Methanolobus tindarius DSM 2278]
MEIKVLESDILIRDVPLEKIVCDTKNGNKLNIEFDAKDGIRYNIEFITHIALKVTIDGCFDGSFLFYSDYGMMYEIIDSEWIFNLRMEHDSQEPYDHIMDNVHHYITHLGDFNVEVVAKGYKLNKL